MNARRPLSRAALSPLASFLLPTLVLLAALASGEALAAKKASTKPPDRCKEVAVLDADGLPLPPPVRKVLVLPLQTEHLAAAKPLQEAIADGAVFADSVDRVDLAALQSGEGWNRASLSACQRSDCLLDIAKKAQADFIYYGTLTGTAEQPIVDLKLFATKKGHPIGRATVEGKDPIPGLEQAGEELLPSPERAPFVLECGPLPLVERPLFVGGVALAAAGGIATLGAASYALDLQVKLAVPEYHRDLKQEALDNGQLALWAIAGGAVVLGAGLALTGAGMVLE